MDLAVFLLWTYAILSWYVMAIIAFAPIENELSGEIEVAFNTPRPSNQSLAEHRRLWLGYLLLAPFVWLLMAVLYVLMSIGEAVDEAKAARVIRLNRH